MEVVRCRKIFTEGPVKIIIEAEHPGHLRFCEILEKSDDWIVTEVREALSIVVTTKEIGSAYRWFMRSIGFINAPLPREEEGEGES